MVEIIEHGNIFDSKCQTLVNTINCVGVMGKGLALAMKQRYPNMVKPYEVLCDKGLISIGKLWIFDNTNDGKWILNFPTKNHWKYPSKIEYIEKGLKKFVENYKNKGITSCAFPLLGCNNGKLNKEDVLPLMMSYLNQCDIPIEIYI